MMGGYPLPVVVVALLLLLLSGKTKGAECTNEETKNELEEILKVDILFVKREDRGRCLVQFRHMPR
jgi:hypothetical protein